MILTKEKVKTLLKFLSVAFTASLLAGCSPSASKKIITEPLVSCEGAADLDEAFGFLDERAAKVKGVKAGGRIEFREFDENGVIQTLEQFGAKFRFYFPDNIFLFGEKFGEAIRLGANEDEFWLRIKPESLYWFGPRKNAQWCSQSLKLSPDSLLEAFGILETGSGWKFERIDYYDVLSRYTAYGRIRKRVYVYPCDYTVRLIEYYDQYGFMSADVRCADFTELETGGVVPATIKVTSYNNRSREAEFLILLSGISEFEPTQTQLEGKLFARPSFEGYDNVYRLREDCKFEKINSGN